jgi:preprotein translocase subunit SecE
VARNNRQRAKQRQEERRKARLASRGETPADETTPAEDPNEPSELAGAEAAAGDREEFEREVDLEVGAPPQDLGTSDDTLQHSPDDYSDLDDEDEEELEDYDFEDEEQPYEEPGTEPAVRGPRGVRGGREAAPGEATEKGRGRLIAFLIAVVAELKRVQWPNRKQLTTMTGIVLGFVLIAGGYLGLLDAIFSRLIKEIL